jgi:hypothetical protein
MMQLAPRMPEAAVPRTLAQSLTELPFGSQTQIRVRDGHLAAFLAFVAYDRHLCIVKYALRVLNNTPLPANAKLFVEARGIQQSAYPLEMEIAPFSMRDEIIPVRLDVTGWFDRAIVHVVTEESAFTVEAPPPQRHRARWARWSALAAIPLLAAGSIAAGQPRVLDVAAPQKALAGSTLRVPYQVSGVGTVEYDFDTRDGLQLAAGLNSRSDVLQLKIPQDGVGAPYVLHVRMRNTFGKDERVATIAAVMPPKPKKAPAAAPVGALIENLAVSPSPAVAGKTLAIRYATKAQSGDVWLLDGSGATWAHSPLSLYGVTQLQIPPAAAGKEMRVVLHAQHGAQHAESSVDLAVMPSQQIVAQATQPEQAPKPAPRPATPNPQLQLSAQVVSAGDTVTATVTGVSGDVRVTLTNSYGGTMAEGNADEGQGVTLNAPNVSAPTTFYVVATLTNGVSQQSIVKRLVVTPR